MQAKQTTGFVSGHHQSRRSIQPAPTRVSARLDARRDITRASEHDLGLYDVPRIPQAARKRKGADTTAHAKKAQLGRGDPVSSDASDMDICLAINLPSVLPMLGTAPGSDLNGPFAFLSLPAQVLESVVQLLDPLDLQNLMAASKASANVVLTSRNRPVKFIANQTTGFEGFKQLMSWIPRVSMELRKTGKLRKGPKPTLYRVMLGYDHMLYQERRVRKGGERSPRVRILDPWVGCYFPGIRDISVLDCPTLLSTLSFWRHACPGFDTLNVGYTLTSVSFQQVLQHPNILNLKVAGFQYTEDMSGMKCNLQRLAFDLQGLDFNILPRLPILNLQQPEVLFSNTGMLIKETVAPPDDGYMTWHELHAMMQ